MTLDEARKVARVAEEADGNCQHCVSELAEEMQKAFPEFSWRISLSNDIWNGLQLSGHRPGDSENSVQIIVEPERT